MKKNIFILIWAVMTTMGMSAAEVNVTKTMGWFETAMVQWAPVADAASYQVVYSGNGVSETKADATSGFTIVGDLSNSKGTATVNGVTYSDCLKIGSSSSVTFSISESMQMTLYFTNSAGKRISVTNLGEITIPEDNIVTATLPSAGEYTIKKTSGESYLVYIALSSTSTEISPVTLSDRANHGEAVYNMCGQRVPSNYKGLVIVGGHKVMMK